jgi:hypothetical protein
MSTESVSVGSGRRETHVEFENRCLDTKRFDQHVRQYFFINPNDVVAALIVYGNMLPQQHREGFCGSVAERDSDRLKHGRLLTESVSERTRMPSPFQAWVTTKTNRIETVDWIERV